MKLIKIESCDKCPKWRECKEGTWLRAPLKNHAPETITSNCPLPDDHSAVMAELLRKVKYAACKDCGLREHGCRNQFCSFPERQELVYAIADLLAKMEGK